MYIFVVVVEHEVWLRSGVGVDTEIFVSAIFKTIALILLSYHVN